MTKLELANLMDELIQVGIKIFRKNFKDDFIAKALNLILIMSEVFKSNTQLKIVLSSS